ncbi:PAQR family membrane homeostasis protein TrhA [Phreatobacter oligotrophus]|jgi:hemolysin III|uniref:Hemolysin III n=1 Tax=Phreatobacter oligotrophus TaxID=1122261 RepID=A0A2T4ZFE0_9HYPH|nr:hemolysin III family protein [Phreatobacter oligotrophus]MBX9991926.1 hemolysin III family protein [Phreatobacter oligotrophus]PTM60580.1 hemolysin III [Phreatobacter oligotrophus]
MTDGRPPGLTWRYDRSELVADGIVHVLGAVAAVFAAGALVGLALYTAELPTVTALTVYAVTLIAVIGCSALYNMWPVSRTKWILRRFDHAAIFLLIAGTYTPLMVHVGTPLAYGVLAFVWVAGLAGAAFKIFAPGRFDRLAVLGYLAIAWSGVVVAHQVFVSLSTAAIVLLVTGGLIYTAGVVFHLWESLRFQNAIWHGFVLVAAGFQYAAILNGVLLVA